MFSIGTFSYVFLFVFQDSFPCTQAGCSLVLRSQKTLESHLTIHSKSYLFDCPFPQCRYKSSTKASLRMHKLSSHKNACMVCCSDFASFELLQEHRSLKICGKEVTVKEEEPEQVI